MGVREWLEERRTAFILGSIAVIAASIGFVIYSLRSSGDGPPEPLAYFYDQNTKTLFVAPAQPGPIATASGSFQGDPAGVRAHVFACGRCYEEAKRFIGWLSKPAPGAPGGQDAKADEELIRRPQDSQWVRSGSPDADQIIREVYQRCSRGPAIQHCSPEHSRQD